MPTRVVDLSVDPHLCLSNSSKGTWVSLSQIEFTTTLETIAERRRAVRLDNVPPMFRDAIVATRRLGYGNVWIDSLLTI